MQTEDTIEEKDSIEVYEIGYLLVPDLSEEKVLEMLSSIRGYAEDKGGVIIAEEIPKLRPLAYSISKVSGSKREYFSQAYFGWVKFELGHSSISLIEKDFENKKEIIRWMCIKTVKENTLVSIKPVMLKKTESTGKKKEISEEELEKSINKLVGEETPAS